MNEKKESSSDSKSTRKFYKTLCSDFVEFATVKEAQPESLKFPESICDLSDFTPLAELVRSFQPRANGEEVEHEFVDGVDDGSFEPPAEFSDPADIYQAINEKKAQILSNANKLQIVDKVQEDKKSLLENSGSSNARVQAAEVKAAEQSLSE